MKTLYNFLLGVSLGFFGHWLYTQVYPEHTLLFFEGYVIGIDACKVLEGGIINQPRPLAHSSRKPRS